MPKAATPTLEELRAAKNADYKVARESGVEFDGHGVGQWASQVKRELAGDFTADAKTGAAGTFGVLSDLHPPAADPMRALTRVEQNPLVTSIALDEVRKKLGRIARDTQDGKPTADAAAATIALKRYYEYLENPPPGHVVAGDAAAYVDTIRRANAGNAAYQRTRDFDSRITNAEDIAARQIAGSEEATIKNKSGALLAKAKQGGTGLNQSEIAQLQLLNSGGPASNTLRQLGRFGAGVVPIGAQAAVAVGTGGTHLVPQAALAAALYAARKGSEAITKSRANKLAEALAQRSPLYEQRKAGLAAPDYTPNTAAILRALLAR
jgi:hypothetical protein